MSKRNQRGSRPRRKARDPRGGPRDFEVRALREAAITRSARRRRALLVFAAVVIVLLVLGLVMAAAPVTRGAEPSPSPQIGDVRSSSAPGLAGDPLFAVIGVVVVAAVAVGGTLLYVRLAPRR